MTKKEKEAIKIIIEELDTKLLRHNKNLTKKQYYAVDDSIEALKYLQDRKYNLFKNYHK